MTPAIQEGIVVVRPTGKGRLQQVANAAGHDVLIDEPLDKGGLAEGPTPYDLILAALGACTSMTIGLYAERKGLPLEDIAVTLTHRRIHAKDCADCETSEGMLDEITREIVLIGPLDDAQRSRLVEIAGMCPVHRTLAGEIKIRTTLAPAA